MQLVRNLFRLSAFVFFAALAVSCGGGGGGGASGGGAILDSGGVPVSGYPGWEERTLLTLTNAVRVDPAGYLSLYYSSTTAMPAGGILQPANYPAAGPLYYRTELNEAARFHSEDMRDNCGLQHDSCDGTLWSDRIADFLDPATFTWVGENAAYGYTSPLTVLNEWLCDKTGTACAEDDSTFDGHRANIMNTNFEEAGMGFASPYWWTQDFAAIPASPAPTPPIAAGSHVLVGSTLTWLVNFNDPGADAQDVTLVLDDTPSAMTLDLGSADSGTWSVTAAVPTGCASYHFEATDDAGDVWRYPGEGEFRTYGVGGCAEDYVP